MSCMSEGSSSRPDLLAGQLYNYRGALVPIKPFNQVLLDLREGKIEAARALGRHSPGASALVRYFVSLPYKGAQHTPMEACFKACSGEHHEAGWHCRLCKALISTGRDFSFFDAYVHLAHAKCTALEHTKRQRFTEGIDSVDKAFIDNHRRALPQKQKEKQTKVQSPSIPRWRNRGHRTSERARRGMCTESDLEDVVDGSESTSDFEDEEDEEDGKEDDDTDDHRDRTLVKRKNRTRNQTPAAFDGEVDELDDSSSDPGQLNVLASTRLVRKASNTAGQPEAKRQKLNAGKEASRDSQNFIDLTLDNSDDEADQRMHAEHGRAGPEVGQTVVKQELPSGDVGEATANNQSLIPELEASVKAERHTSALPEVARVSGTAMVPPALPAAAALTARTTLPLVPVAQPADGATRASSAFSAVSSQAKAIADIVARRHRQDSGGGPRNGPALSPARSTSPVRVSQAEAAHYGPPLPPRPVARSSAKVDRGAAQANPRLVDAPAFLFDCRLRTFAKVGITDKDILDQLLASTLEKEDHKREIDLFVDEVLAGKRVPLTEAEITALKRGLSDYAAKVKGQR